MTIFGDQPIHTVGDDRDWPESKKVTQESKVGPWLVDEKFTQYCPASNVTFRGNEPGIVGDIICAEPQPI